MNRDSGLLGHREQNFFRDVRLERPHRAVGRFQIGERRAGRPLLEIVLAFFELPRVIPGVVLRDAVIKLARDAADGRFVANVRRAESARSHAAEMLAEFGDDRGLAHARRLHGRRHAAGRSAVNAEVGLDDFGGGEKNSQAGENKSGKHQPRYELNAEPA